LEGSEIIVEPKGVREALRIAHDPDLFPKELASGE